MHVGYWPKATERGGANPFESLYLHAHRNRWKSWSTQGEEGESGGKEEVRRLPTIGADVTSTERESTRMQLFDYPSGRPLSSSPCSPPFASLRFAPPSSDFFVGGRWEKSVNRVFGTGFDKKEVLDFT